MKKGFTGVYLPYIYHALRNKLMKFAIGQEKQNKRVTKEVIQDIELEIPTINDKTFDFDKQKELSEQYNKKEKILQDAVDAKTSLILLLKRQMLLLSMGFIRE
jgi:hypothetical protein